MLAPPFAFDLPGEGIEPLIKRFIQAFGSVGSLGFVLMSFMVAAGIAASPVLLSRAGHDARRLRGAQVARLGGARGRPGAADAAGGRRLSARAARSSRSSASRATACRSGSSSCSRRASRASSPRPRWSGSRQHRLRARRGAVRAADRRGLSAGPRLSVAGRRPGRGARRPRGLPGRRSPPSWRRTSCTGCPNETAPDAARIGTARVALLGAAFVTAWLAIAAPADPLQLFLWALTLQRRRLVSRCCCWRSGGSGPTPGARSPA